jgi:predicted enzyme related to lactoylglutathione lyase
MVDDPALILPFYAGLFGWNFSAPMPMNGGEYISFEVNGEQVGGILKRPPGVPEMPPVWMNYFSVPSVEDWSEKAKALGEKAVMARTEIPETGFFALIEDPTGAMAYLFEWAGK